MERIITYDASMRVPLGKWKEDMDEISGQWNGDLPGKQEERAHLAQEAIELINKLEATLNALDY